MTLELSTIGVYGFNESTFFDALVNRRIDTFCDIRLRRGMRGSKYSFVNSTYLQQKLQTLGIRYIHVKELAPTQEVRSVQQREDKLINVKKRERLTLSPAFVKAYNRVILSTFDSRSFVSNLVPEARKIVFFCVEREPEACHRSLVVEKLASDLGASVEHIRP